jgi:hypothetical protein
MPDWAIEYVRAALRLDLSVPEIERNLVGKGVSPAAAAAVVTSVLEERVHRQPGASEEGERVERLHRILSAVVACICILLGYWYGAGLSAGKTLLWVLLPLACIWFPDLLPSRTPKGLIRWVGWGLLLLVGGYRILLLSMAS